MPTAVSSCMCRASIPWPEFDGSAHYQRARRSRTDVDSFDVCSVVSRGKQISPVDTVMGEYTLVFFIRSLLFNKMTSTITATHSKKSLI
jgi:hypothetical protein